MDEGDFILCLCVFLPPHFSSFSVCFKTRQVEALKRELAEDSSRAILRDRLAEKGPAPSPPIANKTREVDYVGFAK